MIFNVKFALLFVVLAVISQYSFAQEYAAGGNNGEEGVEISVGEQGVGYGQQQQGHGHREHREHGLHRGPRHQRGGLRGEANGRVSVGGGYDSN